MRYTKFKSNVLDRDISPQFKFIVLAGLIIAPCLRWLDDLPLLLELSTHFMPQYALMSMLLMLFFAWRRKRAPVALAFLALVLNGSAVATWYSPVAEAMAAPHDKTLRVMHANVNAWNDGFSLLAEQIEREQPDILVLLEFSTAWAEALAHLQQIFPYSAAQISESANSIAVYSRYPFSSHKLLNMSRAAMPSVDAVLDIEGRAVRLLATHPLPPVAPEAFAARNEHLVEVASMLQGETLPTLLVGDFNVTPWSPYYRELEATTGLHNARRGFGVVASWPSVLGPFGIPIDHVLVNDAVDVVDIRAGGAVGSDHLPLVVDVTL